MNNLVEMTKNCRVLVIDDNKAIHDDIRKILSPVREEPRSMALGRALLGAIPIAARGEAAETYEIDSSYQGMDGLEKVRQAHAENRPYAFVFVDVRMPPGWDGIETLDHIWKEDPDIQAVICTAYSDYSWEQIVGQLGNTDRLLILKKPFDKIELLQLATASVTKWNLSRQSHEAMKALTENRDRLFTTLQSIGDGVVATDCNGCIVEINPTAEKLIGRKREDVIGCHAEDVLKFIDNQSNKLLRSRFEHVLSEGQRIELPDDTLLVRSDGCKIPIADCMSPIKSNGTETQGVVLAFRDVTEHRKAQQEIQRLYCEALDANRLKDEFLAIVSHELRTPLTSIMAWVRLLRQQRLSHEQTERAIDIIERSARSQTRLIEDLLDVSRIVSGKMFLDLEKSNLSRIVHSAVEQLLPTAQARSLTLRVLDHDEIPLLFVDPVRMHQIVSNLISNSIKFTPAGGQIEVCLQRTIDSVEIVVKDNGKGISAEFLPHIFDRFRQEDSSSTRPHCGLGLGLAIVKELVEMHGATIEARSEGANRGATFTIKLPLPESG